MKRIKKIIVSLFCVACLVMPSMPVMAAGHVTEVKIGSATLNETNKYYHNGENGAQGEANATADGANAEFDAATGTLTLNGLNIQTSGAFGICYGDYYADKWDITIVLEGENTITTNGSVCIQGNAGAGRNGSSLTIKGNGSLDVTSTNCAIWVWKNITIEENVTLNVEGSIGLTVNSWGGTIKIKDDANVTTHGDEHGIGCTNGTNFDIVIEGGTVTASGNTAAFEAEPDMDDYNEFILFAGDTSPGAVLDENNLLSNGLSESKYCRIEPGTGHGHNMEEGVWKSNADRHYRSCVDTDCDVIGNYNVHTPGAAATANTPQTCTVCNYEITPALGGGGNSGGSVNPGGGGNEGGSVAPGGSVNPGSTGTDSGSSTKKSEKTPEELYMKKLLASAEKVKPGNTMVVDASDWHSFRATALNELTDEKGVSYTFYYKYRGECFYLTVPAGTVFDESIPWYGPYKMNAMFGRTMIDESTLNAAIKK